MVMRAYAEIINRDNSGPLIKVINITRKPVAMDGILAKLDGCTLLATTQGLVADHLANAENPERSSFKPIAWLIRTPLSPEAISRMPSWPIPSSRLCWTLTRWEGEACSNLEQMLLTSLEGSSGTRFRIMTYDTGRQSFSTLLCGQIDLGIISTSGAMAG